MTAPAPAAARVVRIYRAMIDCPICAWAASMTGDTEDDVTYFLSALWLEHLARVHRARPEQPS
jgi:hypothetical protein